MQASTPIIDPSLQLRAQVSTPIVARGDQIQERAQQLPSAPSVSRLHMESWNHANVENRGVTCVPMQLALQERNPCLVFLIPGHPPLPCRRFCARKGRHDTYTQYGTGGYLVPPIYLKCCRQPGGCSHFDINNHKEYIHYQYLFCYFICKIITYRVR